MFRFNAAISCLGVTEIVLQGRKFIWSNMQPSPLLKKLDWVFTSSNWAISYPTTSVRALDMIPSDHYPCVVSISTMIPRNKIFRFENYWLKHQDFQNVLIQSWGSPIYVEYKAKLITTKFKNLRKSLREWRSSMSSLKTIIANVRSVLLFLEILNDCRDLSLPEWNFKDLLEQHLLSLLENQRLYWKQRGNVKWVQLGDAGTHFFHANATIRHRGNLINELTSREEVTVTEHKVKENLLWDEFKQRLGVSEFSGFTVHPSELIERSSGLGHLEAPFSNEEIDNVTRSLPSYKSPGPDGFNNEFMKGAWPVIKQDFYDLCLSFFNNTCCL